MAANMDERVVSMEFDNKSFEKNVKTSMKTIDDLKESLDFTETGKTLDAFETKFSNLGKNNQFSKLNDSALDLRKSISLIGSSTSSMISKFAEITKITAMIHLAESAVRKLENAVKEFTIAPISEGFSKYTEKTTSTRTIANATGLSAEKVDEELQRLNWFTDETSAKFSDMVNNIGKFTSVGKGLSESITAMQGIATWGYHSGASVAEQSRAMYNLSQALGTGSVKLIDWKSIENAGMATKEFKEQAIAAAEAAGELKRKGDKLFTKNGKQEVTAENFNSTLAKGWFTSDVLMDVLEEYGGFATKLNKYMEEHPIYDTASEAMAAMDKERAEKATELYADLNKLLGKANEEANEKSAKMTEKQLKESVERINKIADTKKRAKEISKLAKDLGIDSKELTKILDDLAKTEESLGEKAFKSSQEAKTFQEALDATKDAVSTGWMTTFQHIFGGLERAKDLWTDVTDILWDLFAAGAAFRNNAFMHWAEEFSGWMDLWNADEEKGPLGALRNLANIVIELKDLFGESFKNVFFPELNSVFGNVFGQEDAKIMAKNGLKTVDQLRNWKQGNIMGYRMKEMTTQIREFTARINEFFTNQSNMEKFRKIFEAISRVVQFVVNIVTQIASTIGRIVSETGIFQDILDIFAGIADGINEFSEDLRSSGFITTLFEKIGNTIIWFYTTIKNFGRQIAEFFEESGIGEAIRGFFTRIKEFFTGGENDVDENGKKTESAFFRSFSWLSDFKKWVDGIDLKGALMDVKSFFENFGSLWSVFTGALSGKKVDKKTISGLPKELLGMANSFRETGEKLSGVAGFFTNIWNQFTSWLESSGILPKIRSWWSTIKDVFNNLGFLWDYFIKGNKINPKDMTEKQRGLLAGVFRFTSKLVSAWNKLKGWFNKAWTWIQEKWGLFTDWLETSGILPKIRDIWAKLKEAFSNISLLWTVFTKALSGERIDQKDLGNVSPTLLSVLDSVRVLGEKVRNILDWFRGIWNQFTGWLESSGILPTIRAWWGQISDWFGEVGKKFEESGVLATLKQWWEDIKAWFEEVGKAISENGVFKSVSDFFTNLWTNVTGLFGGGSGGSETVTLPNTSVEGGEVKTDKKNGEGGGFFDRVLAGFKNKNGDFDLIAGISNGIAGLAKLIGEIDWRSISGNVFSVLVDVINGLDDACAKLHIDNILKILGKIASAFTGVMIFKTITDITTAVRAFAKKGKDKGLLEQFSDFIGALGKMLLNIGIAFALMAGSIWLLSTIKPGDLVKAGIVMVLIGAMFVALLVVAKYFSKDKNIQGTFRAMSTAFLNFGIAIGIVVASIAIICGLLALKANVWEAFGLVAAIMVLMTVILAVMVKMLKNGGEVKIAAGIAVFAGMAILLAVIVVCALLMQKVSLKRMAESFALLIGVLFAIVAAMKILNKVHINPKTLATLVVMTVMTVILGIIVTAFYLLKDANPWTMVAIGAGIALAILGITYAIKAMDGIGPGSVKGAAYFAAAFAIIAAGIAAGIAAAIVIISAGAESATNHLVTIMANLSAANHAASSINGGGYILDALGLLPVIVTALAKVYNVNTGPALAVVRAAWDVFDMLSLASVAAEKVNIDAYNTIFGEDGNGGLLQVVKTGLSNITEADTGENAKTLGRNLQALGANLQLAGRSGMKLGDGSEHSEGIANIKSRLTDIQEIITLSDSIIPNAEGAGNSDRLDKFAEGVANIGAALQLYNTALAKAEAKAAESAEGLGEGDKLTPVSTENIKEALKSIVEALPDAVPSADQLSGIEAWSDLDTGKDGKTKFALGLVNIANAMDEFSNSAKSFASDEVGKAVESLGILAEIKNKVENPDQYKGTIDGVAGWGDVGGKDDSGTFGEAIVSMGNAMAEFGDAVKDIKFTSVAGAILALQMLKNLYTELSGNEAVFAYFSVGNLEAKLRIGEDKKTIDDTFADFALGISKLRDGLTAFCSALTDEETGYDQEKVDAAIKVLQDFSKMETDLKGINVSGNFWHDMFMGENGIKKLGQDITEVGARMTTFTEGLTGFDIDVDSKEWKNLTGVFTFFKDVWVELSKLVGQTITYDEETGFVTEYVQNFGYTLTELAGGIESMIGAAGKVQKAMNSDESVLGNWSEDNWTRVKTMFSDLTDLAITLKTGGLEKYDFNLADLGRDVSSMFDALNDSDTADFLGKLENFKTLTDSLNMLLGSTNTEISGKGLALAADLLTGFASRLVSTEAADGGTTLAGAFTSLLAGIDVYETGFDNKGKTLGEKFAAGFGQTGQDGKPTFLNKVFDELLKTIGGDDYTKKFTDAGKKIGEKIVEGFKNEQGWELIDRHSVFVSSMTGVIDQVLTAISAQSYLDQYKEKGKSAGESYAAGFQEGMGNITPGSSVPMAITLMDNAGNTYSGLTVAQLVETLNEMNYPTKTEMTAVSTCLTNIESKYNSVISGNAVNVTNSQFAKLDKLDNLDGIATDVESLKTEVNNLKVYIYPAALVGEIAPEIDRALGSRYRRRP